MQFRLIIPSHGGELLFMCSGQHQWWAGLFETCMIISSQGTHWYYYHFNLDSLHCFQRLKLYLLAALWDNCLEKRWFVEIAWKCHHKILIISECFWPKSSDESGWWRSIVHCIWASEQSHKTIEMTVTSAIIQSSLSSVPDYRVWLNRELFVIYDSSGDNISESYSHSSQH